MSKISRCLVPFCVLTIDEMAQKKEGNSSWHLLKSIFLVAVLPKILSGLKVLCRRDWNLLTSSWSARELCSGAVSNWKLSSLKLMKRSSNVPEQKRDLSSQFYLSSNTRHIDGWQSKRATDFLRVPHAFLLGKSIDCHWRPVIICIFSLELGTFCSIICAMQKITHLPTIRKEWWVVCLTQWLMFEYARAYRSGCVFESTQIVFSGKPKQERIGTLACSLMIHKERAFGCLVWE